MSSLSNKDIVKMAVEICNDDEFKQAIFSGTYSNKEKQKNNKQVWDKSIENRALIKLRAYNLEKNQQEAVIGAVISISRRILIWIEYYIGTFNFSRDFCIEFLERSLFTSEGILDSQKIATKLSLKAFSNFQNFQLASFYCQMERIPELFKNLLEKEKKLLYNPNYPQLVRQPEIIKFWSYYYNGDIDKLRGAVDKIDQCRLKAAIASGSQLAVEYCLKMLYLKTKQNNVVDIAVDVIKCRIRREVLSQESNSTFVNDCVIFRKRKYSYEEDSWAPDCFLTDIFYFLLSYMTESQKSDLLRKLFITVKFETLSNKSSAYVKTLELFLYWPYQDQFLELVKLSWNHLPKRVYGGIILEILSRIETELGHLWYGEDKICDYRRLLMEVWTTSPESFKRYIFGDKKRLFQNKDEPQANIVIKEGKQLLFKMFHLNCFTEDDRKNVISIIKSATHDERIDFLLSSEGTRVCIMLIEKGRLNMFEELITLCFKSSERAQIFRKKFSFLKAKNTFLECVTNEKWDEGEEILKWGEMTDTEIAALKKEIISSKEGMQTCRELCVTKTNIAERFVRLCLPSEESIKNFKRSLLLEDEGMNMCKNFLKNDVPHLADKFVNWCLSTEADINEFKISLSLKAEFSVICDFNVEGIENCSDEEFQNRIVDWKDTEALLSWCFSSESEKNSLKRKLLENSKEIVILKCIELNKWDMADKFISWLKLSPEEVKNIKKEQFFACSQIIDLFDDFMISDENDQNFANCGGKQQAIERFLCFFLVDEESLKEFKSRYRCYRSDILVQNVINKLNETLL